MSASGINSNFSMYPTAHFSDTARKQPSELFMLHEPFLLTAIPEGPQAMPS
jgi:hypothetical protein